MPAMQDTVDPQDVLISFGATVKYDAFPTQAVHIDSEGKRWVHFMTVWRAKRRFHGCEPRLLLEAVKGNLHHGRPRFAVFEPQDANITEAWVRSIPRGER